MKELLKHFETTKPFTEVRTIMDVYVYKWSTGKKLPQVEDTKYLLDTLLQHGVISKDVVMSFTQKLYDKSLDEVEKIETLRYEFSQDVMRLTRDHMKINLDNFKQDLILFISESYQIKIDDIEAEEARMINYQMFQNLFENIELPFEDKSELYQDRFYNFKRLLSKRLNKTVAFMEPNFQSHSFILTIALHVSTAFVPLIAVHYLHKKLSDHVYAEEYNKQLQYSDVGANNYLAFAASCLMPQIDKLNPKLRSMLLRATQELLDSPMGQYYQKNGSAVKTGLKELLTAHKEKSVIEEQLLEVPLRKKKISKL